MQLKRRHRYVLLALGIYWPFLFTLTHIRVPEIAARSGMSDKIMHMLAYLVLVFFAWLALRPYEKVKWNKPAVWLVLAAVMLYGAADEWIQVCVGRSAELEDFLSNLAGALLGLTILSILSFWPALLSLSAIFIFVISNMSRLAALYPRCYSETIFHFTAYTALTLIWMRHLYRERPSRPAGRLPASFAFPLGLLLAVKASGQWFFDRPIGWVDLLTAVFGIAAAVLVSRLMFSTRPAARKD
jgi:hypothetical protein